ncbi:hypothetical protein VDIAB_110739 [Vibrio diabolicus]|nr:hypothetical protein VDIAB_110739 [Vibrio diabolicus]
MDFNLIQTFLIVAEYQSYSRAAEHLGLTQPAISASMKRLGKRNQQIVICEGWATNQTHFCRASVAT